MVEQLPYCDPLKLIPRLPICSTFIYFVCLFGHETLPVVVVCVVCATIQHLTYCVFVRTTIRNAYLCVVFNGDCYFIGPLVNDDDDGGGGVVIMLLLLLDRGGMAWKCIRCWLVEKE